METGSVFQEMLKIFDAALPESNNCSQFCNNNINYRVSRSSPMILLVPFSNHWAQLEDQTDELLVVCKGHSLCHCCRARSCGQEWLFGGVQAADIRCIRAYPEGKEKMSQKGKINGKKKKRGGKIMELTSRDGQITLESENLNKG